MAGRSSVNIMVIALLSVVALILIFLLVFQNRAYEDVARRAQDLSKKCSDAEKKAKDADVEIKALCDLVTGKGKERAIEAAEMRRFASDIYSQYLRVANDKQADQNQDKSFLGLFTLYHDGLVQYKAAAEKAQGDLQKMSQESKQREETHKSGVEAKTKEVTRLEGEISKARSENEDMTSRAAEDAAKHTQQVNEKDEEITRLSLRYEREVRILKEQKEQREETIKRMQLEKTPPKDLADAKPHGAIARVASSKTAFIDLGREHFVRVGLPFEVYEKVGKKRIKKGLVEVNRVEPRFSQVTILEETSSLKPIVMGDLVWSPFYNKDRSPTIAFVGDKLKTELLSLEFLKGKLTALGANVTEVVDAGTDYVVAIEGYKEDPKFTTAQLFGIMVLREDDILSYVIP